MSDATEMMTLGLIEQESLAALAVADYGNLHKIGLQIPEILDKNHNVWSLDVTGYVDHREFALTDLIICETGIISDKPTIDARFADVKTDELERGVTIKSTRVLLLFWTRFR